MLLIPDSSRIKKEALVFLLVFLSGSFFTLVTSQAQNPFIPKYDAVKRSERCFTVTWEANNQFGAVWWADKVDFSRDTVFNFVVYMGGLDGNGADGLAFVMHQDPRDITTDASQQVIIGGAKTWNLEAATGDDGGGLGFAMHQSRVGPNTIPGPHGPGDDPENHKIQNSVAVEFDSWNNNDVPDGKQGLDANLVNQPLSPYSGWDHTAVIYNGDLYGGQQLITDAQGNSDRILPLKPAYAFGSANNPDGSPHHNMEDDRCYTFQIRWEVLPDGTQNLQLWAGVYNGTTNTDDLFMIMTHNDDMINNVFGGNPLMRFGFTGSTGGAKNEQTICLLGENSTPFAQDDVASIPMNTSVVIDVESNDNDPDGDQLHVPMIIDPANHGLATIIDSLNFNYMTYTPNTNYTGLDSIGYVTCDVNSTRCYAKCDTAYVYINVGCVSFDIEAIQLSPNTVCSDDVPSNGAASALAYLNRTIWYEGFDDLPSNVTVDNGASSWSFTKAGNCNNNGDIIRVDTDKGSKKFRVQNSGCEVEWITSEIDISSYKANGVGVTLNLKSKGKMENSDYLKVYYQVDGGTLIEFNNGIHIAEINGTETAYIDDIKGDKLQIVIHVINNSGNEEYFWDNIDVKAMTPTVNGVTFNWYEGQTANGVSVYSGPVANGITDGIYTVIATDQATGCPSNPVNVTIDSAGLHIPGGYIEQIAPFTNCKLPYDGVLEAGIISGPDTLTAGYIFEWYYQEDPKTPFFMQSTAAAFSNLESREYAVIITEMASGCDTTINKEVVSEVIIPTVTAATLADIISCSDPNTGSGEASVGGITNGYDFEWYIGPAIGAGSPDYTTPTVNTFPVGTFTVQAIDTVTSCASESRSISINDLTVLPDVLVTVIGEQSACDTLALTGKFGGAVNEGGVPTISGYTFNWYKGPNDIIPARMGYTSGAVVDSLDAGMYRLVVKDNLTNCISFLDTLIQDITVTPPDITLSTVDVTSCALANGSITINVAGNAADYIYDIYKGLGAIPDSLLMSSNSNVITGLTIGNYTVIAKDVITKCETNPATSTIKDATVLPSTSITSQDQISCDPNNVNGQLSASIAFGLITDYSFEWFEDNFSGSLIAPSSVDGEIISGLDSGNYALRVTHNVSQCANVFYPSVDIGIVLPIELVSAIPSTNCGIAANGQLIATVDGGLSEVDGYTFVWESRTNADTLSATTATLTAIEPGEYMLTIINDLTACASNPAPITVDDNTVIPDPVVVVTANSSCDINNPNGSVQVSGINNEPNPLTDYDYTWYDGNSSGALLVANYPNSPDRSHIAGLTADTIALVITNSITTCSNEVLSIINNINIKPIIDDVAVDAVVHCVAPYMSGASIVSVNSGSPVPAGYTFDWSNLDGGPAISTNGSSISDVDLIDDILPSGNYHVIAYNAYNCASDAYTFTIDDIAVAPTFSLSGYNNISCDVNSPEGSLLASRPNTAYAVSRYEWFENNTSGTLLPTTSPVDSILYNLNSGTYAVRITDALTGCTSVEYASIQNAQANVPIIQNISNIGLTSCLIPNGELGYRVTPFENEPPLYAEPRKYRFYLDGSASSNQITSGVNNVNFTGLSEGDWDAWVVDEYTHCVSDTITKTMVGAPEITIIADAIQLPTSCVGTDGKLNIYAMTTTNDSIFGGVGFNFDWFAGAKGSEGAVPFTTATNKFSSDAVNIISNYYFIEIEDIETGCKADTSIFLPSITLPDFTKVSITSSDRCEPFANGSVSAELTSFTLGLDYSDYDVLLFEGSTFNSSWPMDTLGLVHSILSPAGGPVVFPNDLKPGEYTMVVKENFGNCFNNPVQVAVSLDFTFPEFVVDVAADKSCNGAPLGTGQLEILNTTSVLPLKDFTFNWFAGSISVANGAQTPASLFAGNYKVVGEITANVPGQGCIGDSLLSLPKVLDRLEISAWSSPNRNCTPKDGAIQIMDIQENGVGIGMPGSYINFNIFDADLIVIAPGSGDGLAISWGELDSGYYYLQAQNDVTKCLTEIKRVTIADLSQDPTISIALNNPDYGCNVGAATGELEAFSTAGNQNTGEYSFTWYQGGILNPIVSNLPLATNISANSSTQLYTIEIEDIAGLNQGCKASKTYTLLHQPTTVSLLSAQMTVDPQRNCRPSGSIVLGSIFEDDGTGPISTAPNYTGLYSAQLLDKYLNVIDPLANPYAEFFPISGAFGSSDIPADTFYVRASNSVTACPFGQVKQVIIKDVSKNPRISAILDSPDYACVGGTSTGQLTAVAIGGFDGDNVQAHFDMNWYVKSSGAAVSGAANANNLAPGVYTLEVEDTSGVDKACITSRDYLVTAAKHDIDITASAQDQTICIPDGTAQIETITEDGNFVALPDAGWTVLLGDEDRNDITPGLPVTGYSGSPFTNLSEGLYFIQAQHNLTKCYSDPYQVIINDLSENPVIAIDVTIPQYSLNPNAASWTGALQANVIELATGIPDPGTYVYSWHVGMDDNNPSISDLDKVSGLDQGYYTLSAINNATGCESRYTKYLPFVYLRSIFNTDITPQTNCSPYEGSIEVTDIALDGTSDLLSDYTFNWHHNTFASGDASDAIIPGNDVRTAYDHINPGSYYIIAQENWWMIDSYPVKVEVIDSTTNPIIVFDAAIYNPLTSCDESVFADGALSVDIYEDNSNPYLVAPFNYTITWYEGKGTDPAKEIPDASNRSISGLPSGDYTVAIMNQSNNCRSEGTFTIEDESIIPVISATQISNNNCLIENANGIAMADINNSSESYTYSWYEGASVSGNPVHQGAVWQGRPVGSYTVIAVDQRTGTCFAEATSIQVEDATKHPSILINELAPVSNCDPERPNGVLSALSQDGIHGHTFNWYIDGNLYATGPIASKLGLFDYQLHVVNDVTQCETIMAGRPSQLLSVVPSPDVDIMNEMTSCLSPDGVATASIEGNVTNYIFRYFKKSDGDELSDSYSDYKIYDLDTSTYQVTAEDRTTGCISDPTEFSISNEVYFPEIDIMVSPSNCLEPSGVANVVISDMTQEYKVTWYSDNGYEEQLNEIVYIPVGKYRVEVEGSEGCFSSAEADVKGDILIYNGVSANSDGYNDFFKVVCLEYFPDNNVKIYSRAGVLVYEQDFYDIHDVTKRFEGISNKGANILGIELPIGTYFYVVDKKDGSKPNGGYLELAR